MSDHPVARAMEIEAEQVSKKSSLALTQDSPRLTRNKDLGGEINQAAKQNPRISSLKVDTKLDKSAIPDDKVDAYLESSSPDALKRRASIKKDPSYRKDFTSLEFKLNVDGVDLKSETTLGSDKMTDSVSDSGSCGDQNKESTLIEGNFLQVPPISRTHSFKSRKNVDDDDISGAPTPERREFVKKILTQAETNRIRRNIGQVFHNILTQAEVKRAIRIQPYVRSEKDIARIVSYLKK